MRVPPTTIRLDEQTERIVQEVIKAYSLNRSAAVRYIINAYSQLSSK